LCGWELSAHEDYRDAYRAMATVKLKLFIEAGAIVNIMTIGLSEYQQEFFMTLCMDSTHSIVSCDDVEQASQVLESNHRKEIFNWILIDSEVRATSNRKLLCLLSALNINTSVQFIGNRINVNKNMPKLCSVQRTDAGTKLLRCAMHDVINSPASNSVAQEQTNTPFIFHYSAQPIQKNKRN